MKILTYANKDKRELQNLIRSLDDCHYKHIIVGMGEKWHGVINKTKGYHRQLHQLTDENEVVGLVDAYDVLVCGNSDELIKKYNSISKNKVLFCGERMCARGINCQPLNKWWANKKKHKNRYLNSGVIVGKVKDLRELFDWMLKSEIKDDQLAAIDYVENNPDKVMIDYNHEVIATVTGVDFLEFKVKNGRVINKRTNTKPCIIHIPGSGFDLHFRIDWIGKSISEGYQPSPQSYPKRFCYYLSKNWWVQLLLIIVGFLTVIGIIFSLKTTIFVWLIVVLLIMIYTRRFF